MRFDVECFENVDAFGNRDSIHSSWNMYGDRPFPFDTAPLRRVMNLVVEADGSEGACDVAYGIGNDPSDPGDAEGTTWDHRNIRSMSVSDVVLVYTPDGPVAYGCVHTGWKRLETLPLSIVAALA